MIKSIKLMLIFMSIASISLFALSNEEKRVLSATATLNNMLHLPESSMPHILFRKAKAIAIIPSSYKIGFILGGRYGEGVICVKGDDGKWSNPVFLTLKGGSIGFQAGVQVADIVLVFKSRKSIEGLINSRFTLGLDGSIAVGPLGREVGANTDVSFRSEVYSYSISQGLFLGVSLSGAVLEIDKKANSRFYGHDATVTDIIRNYKVKVPAVVSKLKAKFN